MSELAQPHGLSLPGFMKHLAVLEAAGLLWRSKAGRVVRCEPDAAPMQDAAAWLAHYKPFRQAQLGGLGRYLHQQEHSRWRHQRGLWPIPAGAAPPTAPVTL